jgi:hypothetical protein
VNEYEMSKRTGATRILLPDSPSTRGCFSVTKIKKRIRSAYDFQKPCHYDTVISKETPEEKSWLLF